MESRRSITRRGNVAALCGLAWLGVSSPAAALDLARADSWQLANGMTVIVLEEHRTPVVSVQMLYRVGARNEDYGRTGLAHFLEHMAFRASENFPGTGVTSSIYAVGGEWHGYTWIDQTTYFATLPKSELDLALRIEADRMRRLEIAPGDVEAERGAVLSELHGYENDPASVLHDAVTATAFQQHPYRNNSIGWESDVSALRHEDLVAFYRAHYRPSNAVLAVVGDVSTAAVRARVEELFGGLGNDAPTLPVPTVEPMQRGERRTVLEGAGERSWFELVWIAPSARDPAYPAFLLLQQILAGGSGVNFRQVDGATPAEDDSLLSVAAAGADDLATSLTPAEFPYLFAVSGSVAAGADEAAIESAIGRTVTALRERELSDDTLDAARARVLEELQFDVETTEDAAHELAFFAGIGALAERLAMPQRVAAVTAADVRAVARRHLGPAQRTVGWYRAGAPAAALPAVARPVESMAAPPAPSAGPAEPAAPPVVRQLPKGLVVIAQRAPLTPALHAGLVLPGTAWNVPASLEAESPAWGHTALGVRAVPEGLARALGKLRVALDTARPVAADAHPGGTPDALHFTAREGVAEGAPEAVMTAVIAETLGLRPPATPEPARPLLVTVVGDIQVPAALAAVEAAFAGVRPGATPAAPPLRTPHDRRVRASAPAAQARLAYVVPAPGPREPGALAWQLALYALSHGYEGRLGLEAIHQRGLVYDIDAGYRSDGTRGWVSLVAGVDPPKIAALAALLRSELVRLREAPPDAAEIAAARAHFLGREQTAAQSNAEIAAELARQWLWLGRVRQPGELARELDRVGDADVHRALAPLTAGAVITVGIAQ
jgi:zinc protease